MIVQLRDREGNLLGRKNRKPQCDEAQCDRCDLCGCCLMGAIIVHPDGEESMDSCHGGHPHQWIVYLGEPRALEIFKKKATQ